jgi:Tfp pilus assembly protein PilO
MNDSVKTLLIAVGLLAVIAAAWFFLLYNPGVSKISEIKDEITTLVSNIQNFQVTQEQVDGLEAQIADLSKKIAALEIRVISKDDLPEIVHQIHATGKMNGVNFQKIIPDYDSLIEIGSDNSGEIYKLVMHLQMRANYKQYGTFLEALGKSPFMVSLGNITIAYNPEYFPALSIEMEMILYLDEKPVTES